MATWVFSTQDSSMSPQTVQSAWPVCGTKNFSSVRLHSAPQLVHRMIVAIPRICAPVRILSSATQVYAGFDSSWLKLNLAVA